VVNQQAGTAEFDLHACILRCTPVAVPESGFILTKSQPPATECPVILREQPGGWAYRFCYHGLLLFHHLFMEILIYWQRIGCNFAGFCAIFQSVCRYGILLTVFLPGSGIQRTTRPD
jgi:hypothetical protein